MRRGKAVRWGASIAWAILKMKGYPSKLLKIKG